MTERIGQQLGNYRLIRLVGQGGFADVYLGRHIHLNTQAAIKILQMRLIGSDLELFRIEARTIANLVHPHIVRILDFDIEASTGTPYLVMDYVANGTLRQRHPRGSPVPVANIVHYSKHVASALQYAHDRKLIHRDVKPENMLLGHNNEVYLSDFGLVLEAQSSSSQSIKEMAGTASYMAPEQFQGKPRPASDQYALGIVVYEWLSGARPFHGAFKEIASQHMFVPPSPLYGKVPQVTPALEEVVQRALSKEPVQRFATVQDFANALEHAYLASSPSLSPPYIVTSPIQTSQSTPAGSLLDEPMQSDYMVSLPSQTSQPTSMKLSIDESMQSDYMVSLPSQTSQPTGIKTPSDESLESTRLLPPNQTSQSTVVRPLQDASTQSTYVPTPPIQLPRPTVVLPTQSTSLQLPISANLAGQSSSVTPVVSPAGELQPRKRVISWRTVIISLVGVVIIASTALLMFLSLPAHTDYSPANTPTSIASPTTIPTQRPTATPTHRPSPTATPTSTPSLNPTSAPVGNPVSTPTPTATPTPPITPTPTPTATPTPPITPTPSPTQLPTPTP